MYKLTILFFFLTAFSSQGLMDSYKITFDNENASYTLQIKEGGLVFENQPNVTVTAIANSNPSTDIDTKTSIIYKITKGATFENGLKIGEVDEIGVGAKEIGATDEIGVGAKEIGESDELDAFKEIGGADEIGVGAKEIGSLFGVGNHQACEIMLSYDLLVVVVKSSNEKTVFPISEKGLYLIISGDKFGLLR